VPDVQSGPFHFSEGQVLQFEQQLQFKDATHDIED
jgi:hypothetical protein